MKVSKLVQIVKGLSQNHILGVNPLHQNMTENVL